MVSVSVEILETTWDVMDAPSVVSKNPMSCRRTVCKYLVRSREVCLSAVRTQHNPSVGDQYAVAKGRVSRRAD